MRPEMKVAQWWDNDAARCVAAVFDRCKCLIKKSFNQKDVKELRIKWHLCQFLLGAQSSSIFPKSEEPHGSSRAVPSYIFRFSTLTGPGFCGSSGL